MADERSPTLVSTHSGDQLSPTKIRKVHLALDLSYVNDVAPPEVEMEESWYNIEFVIMYGAFFFTGGGTIAMWSAITLCLDFFTQKYPNDRVEFVFPVVNMSALLVISLYMVLAGRQLPLIARINGSSAMSLFFLVMFPLVNIVSLHHSLAYALTLSSLIGATISSSVLMSTSYGLAGVCGPIFLQALDGGKGFGAILLFIVRLTLKWHFEIPTNAEETAYNAKVSMAAFFSVASWIVLMAWILLTVMRRTEYAKPLLAEYLLVQHETPFTSPVFEPLGTPMTSSPRKAAVFVFPTNERTVSERSPLVLKVRRPSTTSEQAEPEKDDDQDTLADLDYDQGTLEDHASSAMMLIVLRRAAKPFFTLFLSFFVCLSCFPGLVTVIPSTTFNLTDWFPILLVGCYNMGDLIGKNLPMYVMYFDVSSLHWPWIFQLAFVPFFVGTLLSPWSDLLTILTTFLLGITTGYVATSAMILAPSMCSGYQREVAGMIGSLACIIGLCAGSYNGLALSTLVQVWQHGW